MNTSCIWTWFLTWVSCVMSITLDWFKDLMYVLYSTCVRVTCHLSLSIITVHGVLNDSCPWVSMITSPTFVHLNISKKSDWTFDTIPYKEWGQSSSTVSIIYNCTIILKTHDLYIRSHKFRCKQAFVLSQVTQLSKTSLFVFSRPACVVTCTEDRSEVFETPLVVTIHLLWLIKNQSYVEPGLLLVVSCCLICHRFPVVSNPLPVFVSFYRVVMNYFPVQPSIFLYSWKFRSASNIIQSDFPTVCS